jgi:hypothetical protein
MRAASFRLGRSAPTKYALSQAEKTLLLPMPLRPCSQSRSESRNLRSSATPSDGEPAVTDTGGSRNGISVIMLRRTSWNHGSSTQRCIAGA